MSHYTIGNFGGRVTYAFDLDLLLSAMADEELGLLNQEAERTQQPLLDALEARVREGLTEAALGDGDDAPEFERKGGHLFVTAQPASPEGA